MGRLLPIRRAIRVVVDAIWAGQCFQKRNLFCGQFIEPLEARTLLSYTVNSLADDNSGGANGVVTLRWAIDEANNGGDRTIVFDSALTADGPAAITLNGTPLEIDSNLTIQGPGATALTIDANQGSSVFVVDAGSVAEIDGLTITGGHSDSGGGIDNAGTLHVTDANIAGNYADWGGGGGIYSGGANASLTLTDSTISGNSTSSIGGGIYNTYGTLTVDHCIISSDSAFQGAGISNWNGAVNIDDSTISNSSATGEGGGIYNAGTLNISQSTVRDNAAAYGGGILSYDNLTIAASTISGNSASESGGGIYASDAIAITNSTITGNSATGAGGSPYDPTPGMGGGVFNLGTALTVTDCTIAGNSAAADGGGICGSGTLQGSILAYNAPADLSGGFNGSRNLIADNTGGLSPSNHNLAGNPLLGPLNFYGGPTKTMPLLPGSPALDAGSTFSGVTTDQRGISRPQGAGPDIGAFESPAGGILAPNLDVETNDINAVATQPFSGVVASFTVLDSTAASGLTALIDWGDNTSSAGTIARVFGDTFEVIGQHTYAMSDVAPLRVAIGDGIGDAASSEGTATITDGPPSVTTAAHADVSDDGTSVILSVLGSDPDGEDQLTYSWTATGDSADSIIYDTNGDNDAKNTVAVLTAHGDYTFEVTITNISGQSVTSDVAVMVDQQMSDITVSASSVTVNNSATQPVAASAIDQFGSAMANQPTFAWSVVNHLGRIDQNGLYTAPDAAVGSAILNATANGFSGSIALNVTSPDKFSVVSVGNGEIDLRIPPLQPGYAEELEIWTPEGENFCTLTIPPADPSDPTLYPVKGLEAACYFFRLRTSRDGIVSYSPIISGTPSGSSSDPGSGGDSGSGDGDGDGSGDGDGNGDGSGPGDPVSHNPAPSPHDWSIYSTASFVLQSFSSGVLQLNVTGHDFHTQAYLNGVVTAEKYSAQTWFGPAAVTTYAIAGGNLLTSTTTSIVDWYVGAVDSLENNEMSIAAATTSNGATAGIEGVVPFSITGGNTTYVYYTLSVHITDPGADLRPGGPNGGDGGDGGNGDGDGNNPNPPPPPPPVAVENVQVTPVEKDSTRSVRVIWDNTPDSETGYRIERSGNGGQSFSTIDTENEDVTSYVDSNVQPGVHYTYKVIAYNTGGDSPDSNTAETDFPADPTGLTATLNQQAETVSLSWTEPTPSYASDFEIQWSDDGTNFFTIDDVPAGTTHYTDESPELTETNYYRVIATRPAVASDSDELESDPTTVASATPIAAPIAVDDTGDDGNADGSFSRYSVTPLGVLHVEGDEGVLANDIDPQNLELHVSSYTNPSHGTLLLDDDGGFTYIPNPSFAGTDTFTYIASNGTLDSQPATVTIDVGNTPVTAHDDSITVTGTTVTVGATGTNAIGTNDDNPDGCHVTYSLVDSVYHGTLTFNSSNGSFTYTASPGFSGQDGFIYQVTDGHWKSNAAVVTLTVGNPPPAPAFDPSTFPNNLKGLWNSYLASEARLKDVGNKLADYGDAARDLPNLDGSTHEGSAQIDHALALLQDLNRAYDRYVTQLSATQNAAKAYEVTWRATGALLFKKESYRQVMEKILALPTSLQGISANREQGQKLYISMKNMGEGATVMVKTASTVLETAKVTHDVLEATTLVLGTGAATVAAYSALRLAAKEGVIAFTKEAATQALAYKTLGTAASVVSLEAAKLAQLCGADKEDSIRIGADTVQLGMFLLALRQERQAEAAEETAAGEPPMGPNCFIAGTEIITGKNSDQSTFSEKPIQDIQVNDEVLTRNQYDPNGPLEERRVTAVIHHTVFALEDVTIRDANGYTEVIHTTAEHPFYVDGVGWIGSSHLTAGEHLSQPDGSEATVFGIASEAHPEGIAVYNFTVDEDHTYFVDQGGAAVWVHNDCSFRSQVLSAWEKVLGRELPADVEAHHIVPENVPEAAELRAFLREHGVSISDPANGVPLPPGDHRSPFGVHGADSEYIHAVENQLLPLNGASPNQIRARLAEIGLKLFHGQFNY